MCCRFWWFHYWFCTYTKSWIVLEKDLKLLMQKKRINIFFCVNLYIEMSTPLECKCGAIKGRISDDEPNDQVCHPKPGDITISNWLPDSQFLPWVPDGPASFSWFVMTLATLPPTWQNKLVSSFITCPIYCISRQLQGRSENQPIIPRKGMSTWCRGCLDTLRSSIWWCSRPASIEPYQTTLSRVINEIPEPKASFPLLR